MMQSTIINHNNIQLHVTKIRRILRNHKTQSGKIDANGKNLRISDIHSVFTNKFRSASLSEETKEAVANSHQFLTHIIDAGKCVYGVNTGFGGSADVRHDKDEEAQKKLVVCLNVGFGEQLSLSHVKAAMLARLSSVSRGYSGIGLDVVELLNELLNNDIIPYVPKRGSISASGDLIPTSYIASCLEGNSSCKVRAKGKDTIASVALAEAKLSPVVFRGKDALGCINASSFSATLAAEVLYNGNVAILLTQAIVAMTAEALRGRFESFNPVIHETCLPHRGQQEVARNINKLLGGTTFVITPEIDENEYLEEGLRQDRYGLRTSPQWLGPALETALESIRRIEIELNSANDNPLIDARTKQILHCGNFQGTATTIAMDQFRQSMQLCGKLLFALLSEIIDCSINNGLTPNLCGGDPNVDMGIEIAMASYTSEMDHLTNPVSNHVLSAELRNQSVNSLALISARLSETCLELLQMQLTNMMCALAQALELRWIKNRVESIISDMAIIDFLSIKMSVMLKLVPWYKFFQQPSETLSMFVEDFPGPNFAAFDNAHKEKFESDMKVLRKQLLDGKLMETVAMEMGVGTRHLYLFVRETLGIKFHDGENPLDTSLQLIFNTFKDGRIDEIVLSLADIVLSS